MSNFVDYTDLDNIDNNSISLESENQIKTKYIRDDKPIIFDDVTMEYYRVLRQRKMDPILLIEVDEDISFKFYDQWNPYTGQRLEKDPYGPLHFHPDSLIKYFDENKLNGLWVNETVQGEIVYEGYYDTSLGAGEDIYIAGRGYHPEKYVFRLPISNCYWLPDNQSSSLVTMGPRLTDEEVKEIDNLAKKCENNYYNLYKKKRPSLELMKRLYDTAISRTPEIKNESSMSQEQRAEAYIKENIRAVNLLKTL